MALFFGDADVQVSGYEVPVFVTMLRSSNGELHDNELRLKKEGNSTTSGSPNTVKVTLVSSVGSCSACHVAMYAWQEVAL